MKTKSYDFWLDRWFDLALLQGLPLDGFEKGMPSNGFLKSMGLHAPKPLAWVLCHEL